VIQQGGRRGGSLGAKPGTKYRCKEPHKKNELSLCHVEKFVADVRSMPQLEKENNGERKGQNGVVGGQLKQDRTLLPFDRGKRKIRPSEQGKTLGAKCSKRREEPCIRREKGG